MKKPELEPTTIDSFAIFDKDGKEIMRHAINGIVLLAHPSPSEIEKLPKDEHGHYPIISYQGGEPLVILSLLNLLRNLVGDLMQKWGEYLEKMKEKTIWTN